MRGVNTVIEQKEVPSYTQQEDSSLKVSMQFFADELLPYFGISGKVVAFAPTELVHLELQKLFQDFNMVMEDGTWKHFEFQSTNEGLIGLKRMRTYEAMTSYQHKVDVTTYVLFSGNIQNPMTEFSEGVNTYRVVPIIMHNRDANELIGKLQRKVDNKELVTKDDLVPLVLCLLMGGTMSMKDRVMAAYDITRNVNTVAKEDIEKIEAVIYAMADKFLDSVSKEEILEAISMTELGQKLMDKGRVEGRNEGKMEGKIEGINETKLINAKSLIGLLDEQVIAERIGLPLETVKKLKEESGR